MMTDFVCLNTAQCQTLGSKYPRMPLWGIFNRISDKINKNITIEIETGVERVQTTYKDL